VKTFVHYKFKILKKQRTLFFLRINKEIDHWRRDKLDIEGKRYRNIEKCIPVYY
jgi:hypothetical protein